MVAENPCADVIELDTDHTPQLSMTNELAKALHQFATHSSTGAGKAQHREVLTLGEDNFDTRIRFVERSRTGHTLRETQGRDCDWCLQRHRSRDREETDRKELSSGCELPEHYVRDEPTEHCRSETGGRRHGIAETAKRVVSTAIQNFGIVDLLVNNAGFFIRKPFTEYDAEDFRRATRKNLAGFFYVSQLAVAQMRLQGFGHVVNISTSLVSQPIAGVPGSLANLTKAGLESVTPALAIEFAAEGIRFNAIAPGVLNTPMNPVEAHEFLRQLSPLKRPAEVGEVADLLLYLDSAQFVNGEVVHLDGGAHAGKW